MSASIEVLTASPEVPAPSIEVRGASLEVRGTLLLSKLRQIADEERRKKQKNVHAAHDEDPDSKSKDERVD